MSTGLSTFLKISISEYLRKYVISELMVTTNPFLKARQIQVSLISNFEGSRCRGRRVARRRTHSKNNVAFTSGAPNFFLVIGYFTNQL